MRRFTTPTHTFELIDFDVSLIERIKITYAQGGKVILEKRDSEISVKDSKAVIRLTQEDTAKFSMGKAVDVQVRILTKGGDAIASAPKTIPLLDVLDDEVLV